MSVKWTRAPTKTVWGDTMVVADIEIDADHTLSLYCEEDQVNEVNAMLAERDGLAHESEEKLKLNSTARA